MILKNFIVKSEPFFPRVGYCSLQVILHPVASDIDEIQLGRPTQNSIDDIKDAACNVTKIWAVKILQQRIGGIWLSKWRGIGGKLKLGSLKDTVLKCLEKLLFKIL